MHHCGNILCTVELRRLAAMESKVSFVIKFFAIHQNMWPAGWGNTCWQKLRSQISTDSQSWELLNWHVWWSIKQRWPFSRTKEVLELHWSVYRGDSYLSSGFDLYWRNWQTKPSKLAAKDLEISEFPQDSWNHYLMVRVVFVHIEWNALSNLEPWQSYKAVRSDLMLMSAMTLSNCCGRECSLTVDAFMTQLLSQNEVRLDLDISTSTNMLAFRSDFVNYMDRNSVLHDVLIAFDEIDYLLISNLET